MLIRDDRGVGDLFNLLGSPTRLRVVTALVAAGELAYKELVRHVDVTPCGLNTQLPRLRQAGIIACRRGGHQAFWSIADTQAAALVLQWLQLAGIAPAPTHDQPPDEFGPEEGGQAGGPGAGRPPGGDPLPDPGIG